MILFELRRYVIVKFFCLTFWIICICIFDKLSYDLILNNPKSVYFIQLFK